MASISTLRIAVVGGGNIGSAYAYQLASVGGHDVTVIARPDSLRLQQLQHDQSIVMQDGARAAVSVSDQLEPTTRYDLVIVTVLIHQIEALIPALQRSAAARILFMFQQLEPERLRDQIGAERCDFGMPFIQASLDADGRLNAVIGAGGQKSKLSHPKWVALFNAAGLPAVLEPQMLRWLRCHVPLCIALESISFSAVQRGGGVSWKQAWVVARGMQASYLLIDSLGERIYPSGKAWLAASPTSVVTLMLWSLSKLKPFRTLLAQGVNECCALVDIVVAKGHSSLSQVEVEKIKAMRPK